MRFGYSGTLVAIGLLAAPAAMRLEAGHAAQRQSPRPAQPALSTPQKNAPDPRAVRLAAFFSSLHCPVWAFAEDFIRAADENHLDWRLLPSISIVESGGGKAYRNNNIFGWDNGAKAFPSIRHGIQEVASRLGGSPIYRHRDTAGKLRAYNGDEAYVVSVMNLMTRISPDVVVAGSHAALIGRYNLQTD